MEKDHDPFAALGPILVVAALASLAFPFLEVLFVLGIFVFLILLLIAKMGCWIHGHDDELLGSTVHGGRKRMVYKCRKCARMVVRRDESTTEVEARQSRRWTLWLVGAYILWRLLAHWYHRAY